jgi:hypothetical protein
MRRKLVLTLALGAVLAVSIAAVAAATTTTLRLGNLVLTFGGSTSPKALPKSKLAPIALNVSGKIATTDNTHPSAFREAVVDIDKNGAVNATGLPICKSGQLQSRDSKAAEKACGPALVGHGTTTVEIAFPEQAPIPATSKLLLFNGGTKGGKTTLFIHAYLSNPVAAAIVTTVTIQKIHKGRYGFHTISKVPMVAGGSGSVKSFNFTIKRDFTYKGKKVSYLEAKCPDGHFNTQLDEAVFKNEAETPGVPATTKLSGKLIVPCTPKG